MAPEATNLIRNALTLDVAQRAVVANALIEGFHTAVDTGEADAVCRAHPALG